jgi:hypothetical protein
VLGQNSAVGHLARWLEDKALQEDSPEHDFDAVAMIWLAQSKTIGPNEGLKPPGVFVSAMVGRSCAGEPTAARPLPADVPWVERLGCAAPGITQMSVPKDLRTGSD